MNELAKVPETNSDGFVDELQPGTPLLQGQYTISRYLNAGGFGITYLATDSLRRQVVVKECFPSSFCRRSRLLVQPRSRAHAGELRSIVRLFTREAEALAKLRHPNIVSVHQVFEDNNTAYMAIDFIEGHDLLAITKKKVVLLRPDQVQSILRKTLDAIGCVHDAGLLHRDISPDNIIINSDMEPVLIDFGAAREQATKATQALSAMRVVKDGYSPQEFYLAGSNQGPESDLYSLAATFYYVITREIPPDSQKRIAAHVANQPDPYVPLGKRTLDYDPAFCAAVDKAMAILPQDRIQSARDWLAMLDGKGASTRKHKQTRSDAKRGGALGKLAVASLGAVSLIGAGAVVLHQTGTLKLPAIDLASVTESVASTEPEQVAKGAPVPAPVTAPHFAPEPATIAETAGPLADVPTRIESADIVGEWSVAMPFTLDADARIVDTGTATWLDAGLRLTEINGTPVATAADVTEAARDIARRGDGRSASLRLIATGTDGTTVYGKVDAPVAFDTVLADGTRLRTQSAGDGWQTSVLEPGVGSALRSGDVLVGLVDSAARIDAGGALAQVLMDEIEAGRTTVRFAVRRAGSMWVEHVTLVRQSG